jgi:hypothetical protein
MGQPLLLQRAMIVPIDRNANRPCISKSFHWQERPESRCGEEISKKIEKGFRNILITEPGIPVPRPLSALRFLPPVDRTAIAIAAESIFSPAAGSAEKFPTDDPKTANLAQ